MAAYGALVSLMNTVDDIHNHPQFSTSLLHCHTQILSKRAALFLDFIERCNFRGGSRETAVLEAQIASAARAADVKIESCVVLRLDTPNNCSFLLDLQNIIVDMDSIKERVLKVVEERGIKDQQPAYSIAAADSSKSTTIGETIMVGFKRYSHQLMDELTGHQSSRQVISIIGMGGIGKTTLARNTFQNPLIVRHFDALAWVSVSQDCDVSQIFLQALSHLKELTGKLTERNVDMTNEAELGEQLYKCLSGRRYLIVLDDMWSIKVWEKIKFFFPDNDNRSRIILTTRQSDVAIHCGSSSIRVNLLEEDECWNLFCRRVFGHEDCPLGLEQTAKEIIKLCRGLPLSITVIGGILQQSAKILEYWQNVLENLNSILSSGEGDQRLNILYSSYSYLPAHLKPCFLYMGSFIEDSEIQVSRITKLWVAEGIIKPNGTQVLEEIGEDYVKDLFNRSLILIGESDENGKIKSFHIHDLIRDLSISIAEKEKFAPTGRVWTSEKSSVETIAMTYYTRCICYNSGFNSSFVLPSSISSIWNLQTLVLLGEHCAMDGATEIWRMPQLRHIECNEIYLPDPQDEFCVLRNLQTLGAVVNIRWSEEVCKRVPNVKILSLVYDHSLRGYEDDLCLIHLQSLGLLHRLESLDIKLPFCISRYPFDLVNKKLSFPNSLNKLCLTNCILTREDLAMIGSLPHLEVLVLQHNSIWGGQWSCVNGEFPGLKVLRIQSCDVMYWTANKSAFRVLKKLIAGDVWQLKEIPPDMGDINTLRLIHLHHCSESAAISALEISKEQESFGNHDLHIEVNISLGDSSFLARAELESLPIHCVRRRPL